MKKISPIALLLLSITFSAQSFEQAAAEKACKCIKKLSTINDDNYIECISMSVAESISKGNQKENLKKISTVDGMNGTLKTVNDLTVKLCPADFSSLLDKNREDFYSSSKNEKANNFYELGVNFMEENNYQSAIENFNLAIKEDDKFVLAIDNLAMSHRRLEEYDKAISYYKKSLAIYPEGDFALTNIAVVYNLKEDFATSNSYYQKLIDFHPDNPEGYYGLGRNLFITKDYQESLVNLFKAHKIYVQEDSDYVKDSQQIIAYIFNDMKEDGKEAEFRKIAADNNVNLD